MTWCYAQSTAPTLKSTFNAARTVLIEEITNRYLNGDGDRKRKKEKSNGSEGHENPIFQHFPMEMGSHR